jgi:hypothetical protein
MRKFLLVGMLMMVVNYGWAQVNFAPIGAIWYYAGGFEEYSDPRRLFQYEATGDTVIQGLTCRKVVGRCITVYFSPIPFYRDTVQLPSEYFYSNNDTVFHYNRIFGRLLPQFIFNVSAGDTLLMHVPDTIVNGTTYNPADSLFKIVVTGVGFININSSPVKRVYVHTVGWNYWSTITNFTERIGFTRTLLEEKWVWPITPIGYDPFLRCYSDSQIQYHYNSAPCDSLPTTDVVEVNPIKITIFPNPTTGNITIKGIAQPTIAIYNLMGQRVVLSQGNNEVSLAQLPSGMYLVQVFNKDMQPVKSERIMKE